MSTGPAGAALLALLLIGSTPSPAQLRPSAEPVTVSVRIPEGEQGPYRLTPAPGVRAVSQLEGIAAPGELPLTFFLPPSLAAGRNEIASLALPRRTLPVLFMVPARRDVALAVPRGAPVHEGPNVLSITVSNRGNVEARLRVRTTSTGVRVRADHDSVRIEAGAAATIEIRATVPSDARPGAAYDLTVTLTEGDGTPAASARIHLQVERARTHLPVELGLLGAPSGGAPLLWAATQGWLSDSVRLQASYATRPAGWFGALPVRRRSLAVTAPGWRVAGGEIALPRPTEVSPWLSGTGVRAELGRTRGWSLAGGWIRDPATGSSSAQASTTLRLQGLRLDAAYLDQGLPGGRFRLPALGISAAGTHLQGTAAAGVALSGSSSTAVGAGSIRLAVGGLQASASATRMALPAGPGIALSSSATAGIDLRTGEHTAWFATAVRHRTEYDLVGDNPMLSAAAAFRAGARFSSGPFTLVPAAEFRSLSTPAGPDLSLRGGSVTASSRIANRGTVRTEAGLAWVAPSGAREQLRPRVGTGLDWSAGPAFINLRAAYGDAAGSLTLREPTVNVQLAAGLRAAPGSLDLDLVMDGGRGATHLYGGASASLRVGPNTDVLLALRRTPAIAAPPWSVALGLRSAVLRIPVPGPDGRLTLYDDRNANGRRDGGEPALPGVPVVGEGWTDVTDAEGRFRLPSGGQAFPDLSVLGSGWRIGATSGRTVAAVRLGALTVRAVFRSNDPAAIEQTPRGAVVLVTPAGERMPAALDSAGVARWTDLISGSYRAYHLGPGAALPSTVPPGATPIVIRAGAETNATVPSSYEPRRILVRAIGEGARRPVAPSTLAPADTAAGPPPTPAACAPGRYSRTPVRPHMDEAAVRCILGEPARISGRDRWTYWFYPRVTALAGARYDDIVFFHDARVVTALLQTPARRYEGPPPHESIVREMRR